jgi:hypothetical protein
MPLFCPTFESPPEVAFRSGGSVPRQCKRRISGDFRVRIIESVDCYRFKVWRGIYPTDARQH